MSEHLLRWGLASYADDDRRTTRVLPSGELDLATVTFLDEALRAAERQTTSVTLDLRRLSFMDCSSLALLVAADGRARQSGGHFAVEASPMIEQLFTLAAFDRCHDRSRLTHLADVLVR
jgi:anti-anti-sigma factor